jgi:hypothetical protein
MSYHGDIRLGDTIDVKFTTRQFSTGAPFTLAGTPSVAAYVGNGTTEITAGITLTTDFDARTGLNNVRVVASGANGFAAATNVQLVITAGTVDSVSVAGEVVGEFSIENRAADVTRVNGSASAASKFARAALGITTGTVGAASSTTSVVTSALDPAAAVADQFKGKILTFDSDTTTANLRGQSTDITASTSGGVLTVTALTTAPASGDTFTIS